ncbi:MAG: tyrosine-type recombinase/integrase, partial [Deltaproteobacteria bacterium]|nr:tyrosine-type recombinase/integrase [Deltaproteobacteria bacterium]
LRVRDVVDGQGLVVERIWYARQTIKGKKEGQAKAVHPSAREALQALVDELKADGYGLYSYLFRGRQENRPLDRKTVYWTFRKIFSNCGLSGKLGTHCMRKTFADRIFEATGRDIFKTAKALDHRQVNSTPSYLSFREEELEGVVTRTFDEVLETRHFQQTDNCVS